MTAVHRLAIRFTQILFYCCLLPTTSAAIAVYNSKDGASSYSQLTLPPAQRQRPLRPASDHGIECDSATGVAILEDLRKGLDVMQGTWFEVWVGTWPTGIDWTRAVLDTYLVSALSTLSTALHSAENAGNVSRAKATETKDEINEYFVQNVSRRERGFKDILTLCSFKLSRDVHLLEPCKWIQAEL